MAGNDLIPTSIHITRDQHSRLTALSHRTRVSMGAYIRQAVEELMRKA